jgi:hypothetical protein
VDKPSIAFLFYNSDNNLLGGIQMISSQSSLTLSPYMVIYDLVVPKDNMLRKIKELVDFSFILEEVKIKYSPDNGRNAVPPIRKATDVYSRGLESFLQEQRYPYSRLNPY